MAKAKRKVRVKKKVVVRSMRTPKPAPAKRIPRAPVMDGMVAVRDYISLLKDPCNGPLVGPIGASQGGYITRFETTISLAASAGETAFTLFWAPGLLNNVAAAGDPAGYNSSLVITGATTGSGALSIRHANQSAPGRNFLNTSCQSFRVLAACAQVYYVGTEVNRAGYLGSTRSTGARTWSSADQALSVSTDRARVPDQKLEVLWEPSDGDVQFRSFTQVPTDEVKAGANAINLAGANLPNNTVQVRLVQVVQWLPQSDEGIILNHIPPGTGVTLAAVLRTARQAGFVAGKLLKSYGTGGLMGVAREVALNISPALRNMR